MQIFVKRFIYRSSSMVACNLCQVMVCRSLSSDGMQIFIKRFLYRDSSIVACKFSSSGEHTDLCQVVVCKFLSRDLYIEVSLWCMQSLSSDSMQIFVKTSTTNLQSPIKHFCSVYRQSFSKQIQVLIASVTILEPLRSYSQQLYIRGLQYGLCINPIFYFYFLPNIYILLGIIISKVAKTILVFKVYIVSNTIQKISSIGAVLSLLQTKQYMGYQGSAINIKHFHY